MRFLFASDSFKGTLKSERTIELLTRAAKEVFGEVECCGIPVADGGEGTVDAVVAAEHGTWIQAEVSGPLLGKRVRPLTESWTGSVRFWRWQLRPG